MGYAQVVNQASFLHRDLDLILREHVVVLMRTFIVLFCNILWLTEPKQFVTELEEAHDFHCQVDMEFPLTQTVH